MAPEHWQDARAKCIGVMFDGRAQASGVKKTAADATILLVVNGHHDVVTFKLPEVVGGLRWELLIDTNQPEHDDVSPFEFGHEYAVTARSLLLFALKPETPRGIIRRVQEALKTVAEQPLAVPAPVPAPQSSEESHMVQERQAEPAPAE